MSRLQILAATATAIAALAPAAASAADLALRGAPTLRQVDANRATLSFATAERLTRSADGTYRLRIVFANGAHKVSSIVARGRHGDDYRYSARVTSSATLRAGARYTVRFGDHTTRRVKLHAARSRR